MRIAFFLCGVFSFVMLLGWLALLLSVRCNCLGDFLDRWKAVIVGFTIVGVLGWACSAGVALALWQAQ